MEEWFRYNENEKVPKVIEKIRLLLSYEIFSDAQYQSLEKKVQYFSMTVKSKLKTCHYNKPYFMNKYHSWLNCNFILPDNILNAREDADLHQPGTSRGRPLKPFSEASYKTKKRRVTHLLSSIPAEELSFAASIAPTSSSLTRGLPQPEYCLSPEKTVALVLDLDLSERKYSLLRKVLNAAHPDHKDCFPSKHILRNFKKTILPAKLVATETSAEFDLQDILNKTVQSLLKVINVKENVTANLCCKWGLDGSGGHSMYKQRFLEGENTTDEYFFLIAFAPLQLVQSGTEQNILWKNPRTSSTLYCRPIKFRFMKENANLIREEDSNMQRLINTLVSYSDPDNNIEVTFTMIFTMLDGSVHNILSGTNATSNCVICKATPKQMNTENFERRPVNPEMLRFGLSTLHAWIRFFECLLHIAYRLPFKTWQVRGSENKAIFEQNKKKIQQAFKARMGLLVDMPKQGFGSSNDGNTARRFFANPALTSEITGVDKELIECFGLVLRILSSGLKINVDAFKILLKDTLNLYLNLYNWYYLPSSVHKVLVHGCDVIENFDLPIGQLSEDALEARHKEVRKYRLDHTRKSSRVHTNTDLIKYLALTSDPLISNMRSTVTKKKQNIGSELAPYIIQFPPSTSLLESHGIDDISSLSMSETSDDSD